MDLSPFQVQMLVYNWFRKLTDHAPLEEMRAMLSARSLVMTFPEATLRSHDDFIAWYKTVTEAYFDQLHDLKMLQIDVSDDTADVRLIVNWQARTRTPPAPYSKWIGLYAHQRWCVALEGDRAVILSYSVEHTDDMQGPAPIRL